MRPRLTRSRADKIVAGVCGGLGEYFAIDPVIVRLIFVLVTLTSGIGLPIYLVLWILMPRPALPTSSMPSSSQQARHAQRQGSLAGTQSSGPPFETAIPEAHEVLRAGSAQPVQAQRQAQAGMSRQPPFADEYRFDPQTGQPIQFGTPVTGKTVNLQSYSADVQMSSLDSPSPQQPAHAPRRRNWRTLGFILIGIGGLILLEQFDIGTAFVFPILLIVAGIILLKRR